MWRTISALCLTLAACGGSDPSDRPGFRVIIDHAGIEAYPPAELGVEYANGAVERFDELIPDSPWDDPLVMFAPYGPDAVDGRAEVTFSCRPDPSPVADAVVTVDMAGVTEVDMTLVASGLDAGP